MIGSAFALGNGVLITILDIHDDVTGRIGNLLVEDGGVIAVLHGTGGWNRDPIGIFGSGKITFVLLGVVFALHNNDSNDDGGDAGD